METIKCGNCGGNVLVAPGAHVGICANCGGEVPVPDLPPDLTAQYSRANDLLSQSEFADAQHAFEQILDASPTDAAACWGRALSEYGIEYVHDPHTDELLPTFHRLSAHRFSEYIYAKQAVQYAVDPQAREFYTTQCKLIDTIQQRGLEISGREEPYDIFLCYKRSEADETRTPDSRLAADLYKELTKAGYKVFFAEESLHAGEEYEPRIMAALHTARALIAIATKVEFYNAVWVKNEWGRYLALIDQEMKAGGSVNGGRVLIPMFQHMSHGELPPSLRNMPNYVEMDQVVNPRREILQLLARHFGTSQAPAGASRADSLRRQVQAERRAQRDGASMQVSPENYCTRGQISLGTGNFDGARIMFKKALDLDEKYAPAHFGLALCDLKIAGEEDLLKKPTTLLAGNPHFLRALECADPELEQKYMDFSDLAVRRKKEKEEREEKLREAKAALEDTVKLLKSGQSTHPGYQRLREEKKWLSSQESAYRLESRLVGGFDGTWKMTLFFLVGNVLPALAFATGLYDTGHSQLIPVAMFLAITVAYFIPVNSFLSDFMEGCISTIIRFAISIAPGFLLTMGMVVLMEEYSEPLFGPVTGPHIVYAFAGAMALGWAFYFFVYAGGKRRHIRRMRRLQKEAAQRAGTLDPIRHVMDADARTAIAGSLQPYAPYLDDEGEYTAQVDLYSREVAEENRKEVEALKKKMGGLGLPVED